MTTAVAKAGPYYSSGEIKFSSLRQNFRGITRRNTFSSSETYNGDSGPITASELRRNTSVTDNNPTVPNATENANVTTLSNWKTSQFRNTIKFYYIQQTDTNLNFDIDGPPSPATWNSNLNKNIRKFLFVDGTCGSNDATLPAAQLNSTAYNLTVDVSGSILGASGKGGGTSGAPSISGQKGGDALQMTSNPHTGDNKNVVIVRSGGKIWAGGGGGEKGNTGSPGQGGTCTYYSTQGGCGGAPGCPSGYSEYNSGGGGCCQSTSYCCGFFDCGCERCVQNYAYRYCVSYVSLDGSAGGEGGNGGPGRGYNNQTGSLDGAAPGPIPPIVKCADGVTAASGATQGTSGEYGGTGGDWSDDGDDTNNSGNGGDPGFAVFGSQFVVQTSSPSDISSDTIKGAYK